MKIRTIRMWKDVCGDWVVSALPKPYRPLFACGKELLEVFPHISPQRKRLDMKVYTHAVKGAKRFTIKILYDGLFDCEFCLLAGYEGTYAQMGKVIGGILEEQGKKEMFVWVTVD